MAKHSVAIRTQQSARLTRAVIVVNGETFCLPVGSAAYSAIAILSGFHSRVKRLAHPVRILHVPVVSLRFLFLFERLMTCRAPWAGVR